MKTAQPKLAKTATSGGRYSTHSAPEVDALIDEHMNTIASYLKEISGSRYRSVVLVGGFGRGEGGVLVEGDEIKPCNDYDLVFVSEKRIDPQAIKKARQDLAETLQINWVDIVNYGVSELPSLKYTLFNYDFVHAGQVVDGESTILGQACQFDAGKMPLWEAETLFMTRLWCFLGAYRREFESTSPEGYERYFLASQMSKAVLAFQDAWIIGKGMYDPSYARRADLYKELFPERSSHFDLIDFAIEMKLSPRRDVRINPLALYPRVRDLYLEAIFATGERIYGCGIRSSSDYDEAYMSAWRQRWGRLKGALKRNPYQRKTQSINMAQLHLLACHRDVSQGWSVGQEWTAPEMVRAAARIRSGYGVSCDEGKGWDSLREQAAELRMEV